MRHTREPFENRTKNPGVRKLISRVILLLIQMLLVFEALARRWNVSAACLFYITLAGHIRRARLDSKYKAAKPLFMRQVSYWLFWHSCILTGILIQLMFV